MRRGNARPWRLLALVLGVAGCGAQGEEPAAYRGPAGLVVSLGYADDARGPRPWSGSPRTIFIGEPPQCCLTHGKDNGRRGYDAGAIKVTNGGGSAVELSKVTVDFGGGSSPSHFDLWRGGPRRHLPLRLPPRVSVVMTMTSKFNFDTSDLRGEACTPNSRVVPVVRVTANGITSEYRDDHQILNSAGTDLSSCPLSAGEAAAFTRVVPGRQPAAPPVRVVRPSLTGVAVVGRVLSGFAGGWSASPPPSLSFAWLRCDAVATRCVPIRHATSRTYRPVAADVGARLRFRAVASNPSGSRSASSRASALVRNGPSVAQLGHTATGFTSVFVTEGSPELTSSFRARSSGVSRDFSFFARGAGNAQRFVPKVYASDNGSRGVLLGTGETVTVPRAADGRWYVSRLEGVKLVAGEVYVLALTPSAAFNGTYVGAETEAPDRLLSLFLDYAPS